MLSTILAFDMDAVGERRRRPNLDLCIHDVLVLAAVAPYDALRVYHGRHYATTDFIDYQPAK